jgi:hypothetical protein
VITRGILKGIVALLGLGIAWEASLADSSVWLVADHRLTVETPMGSGLLALYVSKDLDRSHPDITRAVITIHGFERSADIAKTVAEAGRAATNIDPDTVLLIEPQFLDDADIVAQNVSAQTLRWNHAAWEVGGDAIGPAPISSFAALDTILARLADPTKFPGLKTVVIAGHSGGAQLVQRYAVAGHGEEVLIKRGIHVRYVVANPSSYVYFDRKRPAGEGFANFDATACHGYDDWKYGMSGLPPYDEGGNASAMEAAYVTRDVIYLLGTADTNPRHSMLDKSCMAEAQGPNRYERGLAYFRYLKLRHPTNLAHRLRLVQGVGHDSDLMLNSACGLSALYDVPDCGGD